MTLYAAVFGSKYADSRGDGDQSCGTTAAMGLSFSHVHEISRMRVQGRMYIISFTMRIVKFTLLAKLFVLHHLSVVTGI